MVARDSECRRQSLPLVQRSGNRVLKGREDSWRPFRTPELNVVCSRRITSGYHLSAALRQARVFKQLVRILAAAPIE